MFSKLKKIFSSKRSIVTDEEYAEFFELKEKSLEVVLGKMHGTVGHAIIPFQIGGAVDMYYYPNHISGTGFATQELLEYYDKGPKPNKKGLYELVAFTRHLIDEDASSPYNLIERRLCGVFTVIGNYSKETVINAGETCEIPGGDDGEDNICLLFDNYLPLARPFTIGHQKYHLLLCIEIYRSELDYCRSEGSDTFLAKYKQAGYYPYSDMDRTPVV